MLSKVFRATAAAVLVGTSWYALAQSGDASTEAPPYLERAQSIVSANSYEITFENGVLGGPGWERLQNELANRQFLLIGEVHNAREVNLLTLALHRQLGASLGYDKLVLEQDALLISELEEKAESLDYKAFKKYAFERLPSLHFFTEEELYLYYSAARTGPDGEINLWGVDRALSPVPSLKAILPNVEEEELRVLISDTINRIEEFEAPIRAHEPTFEGMGKRFITTEDEAFDSLVRRLRKVDNPTVSWMSEHLEKSRFDMRLYHTKHPKDYPWGYIANLNREDLMKWNFARHYNSALKAQATMPKAIVKMGHWHVSEGRNRGSVYTLGNALKGSKTVGGKGALSIAITLANVPGQHWTITDYDEFAHLHIVADPEKWMLVDLRPLRGQLHSNYVKLDADAEQEIFQFDYVLILGDTRKGSLNWISEIQNQTAN